MNMWGLVSKTIISGAACDSIDSINASEQDIENSDDDEICSTKKV